MSEDASDSRGFFRQFLKRVVDPAAAYAEKHLPQPGAHLRPPGALPASAFQDTCRRCGQGAEVCPADAIKHHTDGTPYIDPADQPCVARDGLRCMAACPSGPCSRHRWSKSASGWPASAAKSASATTATTVASVWTTAPSETKRLSSTTQARSSC